MEQSKVPAKSRSPPVESQRGERVEPAHQGIELSVCERGQGDQQVVPYPGSLRMRTVVVTTS